MRRMKTIGILATLCLALLFGGCNHNPQEELDGAFKEADEIIITTYFNSEEVTSVKFTYPQEEKHKLQEGILPYDGKTECSGADGKMIFVKTGKTIMEMQFHVGSDCESVWINDGLSEHHFPIDSTLSNLLRSRLELVKQLKGGTPPES